MYDITLKYTPFTGKKISDITLWKADEKGLGIYKGLYQLATKQSIRCAHRVNFRFIEGFLIQTETSVYLSNKRKEVENLITTTDTSSGLHMSKMQMIRAEMPLEQNTELFYFVVKDSSSQSQSIVELRIKPSEMDIEMARRGFLIYTKKTIFTSSSGDILALEYDKDTFSSPDGHRLFVVD